MPTVFVLSALSILVFLFVRSVVFVLSVQFILTYPTLTYIYPMVTSNVRDHFLDLSYPSLSYLITSFPMQFYPIHPIQSCPILSYRIPSRLPIYLSTYLPTYVSINQSIDRSIDLSIHLSYVSYQSNHLSDRSIRSIYPI